MCNSHQQKLETDAGAGTAGRKSLLPKAALAQKGETKATTAAGCAWPPLQALTCLSAPIDPGGPPAPGKGLVYGFHTGEGRWKHLGMFPSQRFTVS